MLNIFPLIPKNALYFIMIQVKGFEKDVIFTLLLSLEYKRNEGQSEQSRSGLRLQASERNCMPFWFFSSPLP